MGPHRFGAAADLEAFEATDGGDQEGEERRFDHAHQKVLNTDVRLQQRQEHRWRNIQRHRADHAAADNPRNHRQKGQHRQRNQQGQHTRHHQQLHRIETQGADGVDFLVGLHRADLRRERTGGAPGHQDRGQQHTELA
ncbi:hypothetical protein D3C87_1673640 [compost metagenome]